MKPGAPSCAVAIAALTFAGLGASPGPLHAQAPASGYARTSSALSLGGGAFVGYDDGSGDGTLLHVFAAYEAGLVPGVSFVGEGGIVTRDGGILAALAPALRLDLMPRSPGFVFLRAGPALFGTTSGAVVAAHLGAGVGLTTGPGDTIALEARTYTSLGAFDSGL